ncbi:MAG TPA: FtsX-like permease family protein, partial [Gemmataceae bacterium]|nr:FtsX-like permease family protein [Gemmataceae bacterium]
MLSVYTTLSLRYLRRRWVRAILIVLSIAAGVSMLVATRALNQTMDRAAAAAANPLAGVADLLVSNGDAPVERTLAAELRKLDGVQAAHPRIFANVKLPDLKDRTVLLVAIDLLAEKRDDTTTRWHVEYDKGTKAQFVLESVTGTAVLVGKSLDEALTGKQVRVQAPAGKKPATLTRAGAINASGAAAALGGNVLLIHLNDTACRIAGIKEGMVSRIDLTLKPGAHRETVQKSVAAVLAGRGEVRTPEEQNQTVQNVMVSLQVGLLLCGVAALVVGLFLVYNALSVSVTERRHEIGILRGIGATRGQVIRLFTGEAALLGLAGSLLGIPLGLGIAHVGLDPMQEVLSKIFFTMEATAVEISGGLFVAAVVAGVLTAVVAALVPALLAARDKPAEAVRRIPVVRSWRYRFAQVAASVLLLVLGVLCIALRDQLLPRAGMYGGLGLVVLSALLATPALTAVLARLLQPLARRCLGIEGRLAADNLVRAPGRTGLVIAALAAGVALVMQTAGIIRSNRIALREWVRESIASDLIVTAGSPVSAGGQSLPMDEALGVK